MLQLHGFPHLTQISTMETLASLPASFTAPSSTGAEAADMGREHMYSCSAEEVSDAKLTTRRETLLIIECLTQEFLRAIANGDDPELHLVNIYNYVLYLVCVCVDLCVHTCTGYSLGKECAS